MPSLLSSSCQVYRLGRVILESVTDILNDSSEKVHAAEELTHCLLSSRGAHSPIAEQQRNSLTVC